MIKNLVRFEYLIEGKIGHFLLENDTSVAIAKEMAFQFLKYLGQLEDRAKAEQTKSSESPNPEKVSNEVKEEDGNKQ
jgi:hypothetical protein